MNSFAPVYHPKFRRIRVLVDEKGSTWWPASDACRVLNLSQSAFKVLGDDEKGVAIFDTLYRDPWQMPIVNKSGVFSLVRMAAETRTA